MSKIMVDVLETRDGTKTVNVADLGTATASNVANAPAGNISATTVQAAINELDAEKFAKTGGDIDGNINLTGTARRITGDFSNATVANRVMFQTTTANSNTTVAALPSGSATTSGFLAFNDADPNNASEASLLATPTDVRVSSAIRGTGVFLPLTFYANGLERLRIDPTTGNVLASGGALGYGVGAGGTVTQDTNKTQAVTLNKPSMEIKLFRAAWTAGEERTFQVINSLVSQHDTFSVTFKETGIGCTWFSVGTLTSLSGGSFYIGVRNISGSALADTQITLQVNLIKGSIT